MHQTMVQCLFSPMKVTCSHFLAIVQNTQLLRVELASMVDFSHPIVKATYPLEGDGPLISQAYEEIVIIRAVIQSAHYPSLLTVTQQIVNGGSNLQQRLHVYIPMYVLRRQCNGKEGMFPVPFVKEL